MSKPEPLNALLRVCQNSDISDWRVLGFRGAVKPLIAKNIHSTFFARRPKLILAFWGYIMGMEEKVETAV